MPARLLRPSGNILEIRASREVSGTLQLYRITVDSVRDGNRSERSLAAVTTRHPVFAFDTHRRSPFSSVSWNEWARLLVHIDRDEPSLPAQLSWRGEDRSESAISIQPDMCGFYRYYDAADGTAYEYRGGLNRTWSLTEGIPDGYENISTSALRHFRTEEGQDGSGHGSSELRLWVDDGGAPKARVAWRDQRGGSGVAVMQTASAEPEVTDVMASDEDAEKGAGLP